MHVLFVRWGRCGLALLGKDSFLLHSLADFFRCDLLALLHLFALNERIVYIFYQLLSILSIICLIETCADILSIYFGGSYADICTCTSSL